MIKKLRKRIILLSLGSFIATTSPLVIAVLVNRAEYITQKLDIYKLSLGGIVVVVLLFAKAMGALKNPPRRIVLYSFLVGMCWLLSSVLQDVTFLLSMCLAGEILDFALFRIPLKMSRARLEREKTGDVVSDKMKETIKEFLENGTVI